MSPKSGKPSSDDLLLVAFELGTSWKMLGRALGLPEPVLEQIEEDEHNLFDKCFSKYELLIDQLTVGRVKVKSPTIVQIGTSSSSPSSAYLLSMKRVGNPDRG